MAGRGGNTSLCPPSPLCASAAAHAPAPCRCVPCTADVWAALVEEVGRRADLVTDPDPHKRRAKLARWLASRGHSWDVAKQVFKELGI